MSRSPQQELPLARVAGGAAVVAGALFAVAQLGQLATLDRADIVATTADPLFRAFSIAYAAGFVGLVIALAAIHVRQARAAGVFGLVGFGAAVLGTMSLGADMWFEAFASPWLVSAVPALLDDREGADLAGRVPVELPAVRAGLDPVRAQQPALPRRADRAVGGGRAGWGDRLLRGAAAVRGAARAGRRGRGRVVDPNRQRR